MIQKFKEVLNIAFVHIYTENDPDLTENSNQNTKKNNLSCFTLFYGAMILGQKIVKILVLKTNIPRYTE